MLPSLGIIGNDLMYIVDKDSAEVSYNGYSTTTRILHLEGAAHAQTITVIGNARSKGLLHVWTKIMKVYLNI
ncbi:hypothetical protein DCC81_02725 [Chitinophaga parva]|uniref:Uncharacterized protein n=1 Tax=Chitinophaga parva TaxID=2169414 RepID=A0A2T7BL59_9BACT|nr:hypothetical protein DCC81_02725 [Chitinophaga parva]